ncbi:MAG: AAA family ATPase, partial [Deltaproteobacteria bacterium]|nr:AAA family ATPase [Deltaproteobacteria bacterium]
MKNLPLAIQNLREIIEGEYVYVDKTDLLRELIKIKQVFLSRPRRFGKSLFLDTLEEVFQGNADLFSGLKIAASGYEFKKYPVLRLSMTGDCSSPELLKEGLITKLEDIVKPYFPKVKLRSDKPGVALQRLIKDISQECGEKVVALIDEYDYPVSHYTDNPPLAKANTAVLSSFYVGFKEVDEFLRFVMVTGVTRYAMMGLSAGLNQLVDISFNPKYAAICGFTPDELDQYFGDRYDSVLEHQKSIGKMPVESSVADLRQKIFDWYDGYTWDGRTRVLNPISILNFFNDSYFKEYWNFSAHSYVFLKNTMAAN